MNLCCTCDDALHGLCLCLRIGRCWHDAGGCCVTRQGKKHRAGQHKKHHICEGNNKRLCTQLDCLGGNNGLFLFIMLKYAVNV